MDSLSGRDANAMGLKRTQGNGGRSKLITIVVGALIALLLVAGLFWFFGRSSTAATIDSSKYQAVFFTNGQVYFGKLGQVNDEYFKLTDVFYIQAAANTTDSKNPQDSASQSSDVQLIKLGSEVHGPDDAMIISKDQVLFFENLKKDGKVSDSITKYNAENK